MDWASATETAEPGLIRSRVKPKKIKLVIHSFLHSMQQSHKIGKEDYLIGALQR